VDRVAIGNVGPSREHEYAAVHRRVAEVDVDTVDRDAKFYNLCEFPYPSAEGPERPRATARRAANAGLPEVGVLDSSKFASLHPGYAVVFSGVYSSRADAEAALTSVRASGFGGGYVREISA